MKIQYHIFFNSVLKKQFFAILNLAHLFLQKDRQKTKELNCFPQQYGMLSALFCASHSIRSKAQACGSMVSYILLSIH